MKNFLFLIALIISTSVFAQSTNDNAHPIVKTYTANVINNKVLVKWVIKGGYTCNGIDIYRSTNSIHFNKIGTIAGICGSTDFPVSYQWFDKKIEPNAINYYKLDLGGQGFTKTISIHYTKLNFNNYLIYPNPVSSTSILSFSNPKKEIHSLFIYNMEGKQVYTENNIAGNQVSINGTELNKGMYFFVIQQNNEASKTIKGKFIVQ